MNTIASVFDLRKIWPIWIMDGLALVVIYFIPALSHLAGIPFYLFEPMRIFIILSLIHSNRTNSYLLALGLPLFSFLISSHPVLIKAGLISFELIINVFLFYLAKKRMAMYWAILLSVLSSKILYYMIKYILIQSALLNSSLISTPIFFQVFTMAVFGLYAYFWYRKNWER